MNDDYTYLHELEYIEFASPAKRRLSELRLLLIPLGFKVHDDTLSFDRTGRKPPWQSSSIICVTTVSEGIEVYGFDEYWDVIRLEYLFATLPYELSETFIRKTFDVSECLRLPVLFQGSAIGQSELRNEFSKIQRELRSTTGLEAGSEELAVLIHSTYPRK